MYKPETRLLKLGYTKQHITSLHLSAAAISKHPKHFYQLKDKLVEVRDAYYVHNSAIGIAMCINRKVEFEDWREL